MRNGFTVTCWNIPPSFSFALHFSGAWLWEGLHSPQPPSPGGLQELFLLLAFGLTHRPAPQVIELLPERAWGQRIWLFPGNHTDSSAFSVAASERMRGRVLAASPGRPSGQRPARGVADAANDGEHPSSRAGVAAGDLDSSNIDRNCSFVNKFCQTHMKCTRLPTPRRCAAQWLWLSAAPSGAAVLTARPQASCSSPAHALRPRNASLHLGVCGVDWRRHRVEVEPVKARLTVSG